jgi:NAD(P)-dependent dehydrogenase (short-subunit alcohol dehydrogenase family)
MPNKTWFITGASSGFGHEFARAALARGDRVAGTSREINRLDQLAAAYPSRFLAIQLDVTDRAADFGAVERTCEHFGGLDIVVNNAGYGQYGVLEELTEGEARRQFDTNFFGPIWVTQAALPFLRAQGSGHIIQVSSIGAHFSSFALGLYCSSKSALEAISQALASEVAEFGISVTMIEPGGFGTRAEASSSDPSQPVDAYKAMHDVLTERRVANLGPGAILGDPSAGAEALLAIIDAADPPLRVVFGSDALARVEAEYERRLAGWRAAESYTAMSAARSVTVS